MNLDKSTKRIAKRVNKGFQGYPQISLSYFGDDENCANEVVVSLILEHGGDAQEERFASKADARKDELIQTTLLKVIERAQVKTVLQHEGVILHPVND